MIHSEPEAMSRKSKQRYRLNLKSEYTGFYPSKAPLKKDETNCERMVVCVPPVPLGTQSFSCHCSSEIPENSYRNLCTGKILNEFFDKQND